MKRKTTIRQSSANLFADLKLPGADELHAKARIAYQICAIVKDQKLTQRQRRNRSASTRAKSPRCSTEGLKDFPPVRLIGAGAAI